MSEGRIVKAMSGFWYVSTGDEGSLECRARGRFRLDKQVPLVGDIVTVTPLGGQKGSLTEIKPRKNEFLRPAVANIDMLVIIASAAVPVTDRFLIDRMTAIAELKGSEPVICINKCDIKRDGELYGTYRDAGFTVIEASAETGEGMDKLRSVIEGKLCAFTGNSGVGKSSILNCLEPSFGIRTGQISNKLGRGRHTTRHVELFEISGGTLIADTPGFASFDGDEVTLEMKNSLPELFREFGQYTDKCRYKNCAHVSDGGCAVLEAVREGKISRSRHDSYVKLYTLAKELKQWQIK